MAIFIQLTGPLRTEQLLSQHSLWYKFCSMIFSVYVIPQRPVIKILYVIVKYVRISTR
jgi:hypothetical protein